MNKITQNELSDSLIETIKNQKIKFKKNTVNMNSSTNKVIIGIPTFNKNTDLLMVFKNSVYLEESIDYIVSGDSLSISSKNGNNWNISSFNFICISGGSGINIGDGDITSINGNIIEDGTINEEKLSQLLQDKITFMENNIVGIDTRILELDSKTTESIAIINSQLNDIKKRVDTIEFTMPEPSSDDTDTFQKLLNIGLTNPVKIKFGKGTWTFNNTLNIFNNTTIEMSKDTILKRPSGLFFLTGRINDTDDAQKTKYDGYSNIHFTGGTIVGHFISMIHVDGFTAKGVTIRDNPVDHYMEIASCRNVRLTDCSFSGMKTPSAGREYVEYIQIDSATRPGFPRWQEGSLCFDEHPNENIVIEDCSFSNVGSTSDFNYLGCAIGSHGEQPEGKFHKGIKVTNCIFEGWSYSATRFITVDDGIVENCIFKHTELTPSTTCFGVRVSNCNNYKMTGNIFRRTTLSTTRIIDMLSTNGYILFDNVAIDVTTTFGNGDLQLLNVYDTEGKQKSINGVLSANVMIPSRPRIYYFGSEEKANIMDNSVGYDLIYNGSISASNAVTLLKNISEYSTLFINVGVVSTGTFITSSATPFYSQKFSSKTGQHSTIILLNSEGKKCKIDILEGDMSINYTTYEGASTEANLRQIYGVKSVS